MAGVSQRLELRQGQALVMTPQLLQAIKLLQLSTIELATYVENELERNPLLERVEDSDGPVHPEPVSDAAPEPQSGDWLAEDMTPSREAIEERLGTGLDNVFQDDRPVGKAEKAEDPALGLSAASWSGVGAGQGYDGEGQNFESYTAAEMSLHDRLIEQLHISTGDPGVRMIGLALIDAVDEAGYCREDLGEIAYRLGVELKRVEDGLALLHTFEPTGVGARNLVECLRLQLAERNRLDPAMAALLDHLPLLARRDFASLRKVCGVGDEDLVDMAKELKSLDPKPGLQFSSGMVEPVVPDVYVRSAIDGSWRIELNTETLPRVLVNQIYYATVNKTARTDSEKTYVADCLQSANWLTRSLEQRAKTILKVATEIVRQQDGFLTHGLDHLRPLNLKTVADAIGMHESTVSRVTSNKYVATPRGTFEMKYFFTAAIAATKGGDAHSAEAVRHRIKQMIDAEAPKDVLSDDAIVQKLRDHGIDIARRTVAKYREGLRIPSSVERRRDKMAQLAAQPA